MVGMNIFGVYCVLGVLLCLYDVEFGNLVDYVFELLLGKFLVFFMKVFVVVVVVSVVGYVGKLWIGFKWLIMFNWVDFDVF